MGWAQEVAPTDEVGGGELEDVTVLPTYKVKGRPPEELGFRIAGRLTLLDSGGTYLMIREVIPNTAAAKAGLRPGELIAKIDGKSPWLNPFKLGRLQGLQWIEGEGSRKTMTVSMEVRAPHAKEPRKVTIVLPSPAPHWGSEQWNAPEGRTPAVVKEMGPMAALAREVMDNGIWSMQTDTPFLESAPCNVDPVLGYRWMIVQPSGTHAIWVSQQRGKTEILLTCSSSEMRYSRFLTSPAGAMDKGACLAFKTQKERREVSPEEVRVEFQREMDFWLTKVRRVTGRWPFEAWAGETAANAGSSSPKTTSANVSAPLAESFLKLPVATVVQKQLFLDALGKIGLDGDGWAFTETSRALGDDHATTVRFDPSMPPEESSILLKVDGKAPKAAYLQQWRKEGHGPLPGLGELPPLSSVVDVTDVRIYADEMAAVVFELPVKASNAELPADKFLARFRVNKTHRGFEDFSVKLREPMRVAGIAKVTDAGLEARFQMLDPALAPQPVWLRMGGGVRVLFVKISRAFEVTRTDFTRVAVFEDFAKPAP
ncbi:MAG: hypothetical protein JWM32_3009 [Verrucomicrobia bacterium]|nr:hypothetical protein [Verrucomicrobiota bacterium]